MQEEGQIRKSAEGQLERILAGSYCQEIDRKRASSVKIKGEGDVHVRVMHKVYCNS